MQTHFTDLGEIKQKHKNQTIVLVGGVFDMIHPGHVELFKKCKELGDVLVVAVVRDMRVKERKGEGRPIVSEQDRLYMVDAIRYVDYALLVPERGAERDLPTVRVIDALKPTIFVSSDERWLDSKEYFKENNIEFIFLQRLRTDLSTTSIIEKVCKRHP